MGLTLCHIREEVYDLLNVESNNHFSIKVSDTLYVEVHNCTQNSDGNILEINSENQEIKKVLEDLFFNKLKINSQGYLLVKEMLKFGNLWAFINTRRGEGVTDLIYLPPEQVRFEYQSNAENLDDFSYIWSGSGTGRKFEPWEVVHFKNIEDLSLQPYGTSILRSVVDTWRRIILMREALIIYRITRAPQRMLFKIDTSGMDADAALNYANEIKKSMYKKPMQNSKGEIDFSVNPISIEENIYMPTFSDDVSGVELLQGAGNLGDVEDYKIIKEDLFAGLIIPKSFLTFEESLCLESSTKLITTEGVISIEELSEIMKEETSKKRYVLSINNLNLITASKILKCYKTKSVKELYEITLTDGAIISCTSNHPFLLGDGTTYVEAEKLQIGQSLRGNLENKIYEVKYITIKYFDDLVDVYDLEVDIHHNFALESGIFVHNSNKNALRQEDLRFSNAIKRHQASFVEGLIHIAIVHLNLLGFSKKELESFTINMATNSKELEKIELEILQQRIDLAKNILDVGNGQLTLMSFTQVLRDILKFSDAEIEETLENLIIEKRITWRLTKLAEDGFFEEPEKNKLDSKLSDISKDEILSKLKFENTELISPIKTILTRKVKEDVKFLIEGKKTKVTKKQLKTIIGTFKTKYGKELEE